MFRNLAAAALIMGAFAVRSCVLAANWRNAQYNRQSPANPLLRRFPPPTTPYMQRLSFKEKLGFSMGDLGGSGFWQIFIIFLPIFYTDVFGIEAKLASGIFLYVRLLDAVTDPIMGIIADRTNTRWGKFRPWLLWTAVPFAVIAVAVFWAPASLGGSSALVYAYITYGLMMVIYTMTTIPLASLSGVMSSDPDDRTSLNSIRFFIAFAAAALVQGLWKPGVRYFGQGDEVLGTRVTVSIFALLAIIGFVICFASTKERVKQASKEQPKVWDDLKDLIKNRAWLIILALSMINAISYGIRGAAQAYYFKYYVGAEDMVSSFMVWGTVSIMAGILITPFLVKLLDKRRLFMVTQCIAAVLNLLFYWIEPGQTQVLFGLQIALQFIGAPAMPLLWSMMADAADYGEWKSGRRATGLVFSASTFSGKAGGALGGFVSMMVLAMYGYVANAEQNASVLEGMRHMMSFYPAAGALLMAGALWFYNLDRPMLDKINTDLKARAEHA